MEVDARSRGLSKQLFNRVISTVTPNRSNLRALVNLLTTYLLRPPTFQVGLEKGRFWAFTGSTGLV